MYIYFCSDDCKCLDKPFEVPLSSFFQAALYAAPYRSDFLKALSKGREVKDEECLEKVRQFLVNFTATIDAIYEMYTKMNAELDYTVWSLTNEQTSDLIFLPPSGWLLPPIRRLLIGLFLSPTGSSAVYGFVFSWGTIRVRAAEDSDGFWREDVCYCLFCSCWRFKHFGFSLEKKKICFINLTTNNFSLILNTLQVWNASVRVPLSKQQWMVNEGFNSAYLIIPKQESADSLTKYLTLTTVFLFFVLFLPWILFYEKKYLNMTYEI